MTTQTAHRSAVTPARRPSIRPRLVIGAAGMLTLLAALWAALLLLGLSVPAPRPDFAEIHGPLMVLGFLGTLIALERAVAIDLRPGYAVPALAGFGGLAVLVGAVTVGKIAFAAAGIGLIVLYAIAATRQASTHLTVMAGGAVAWVVASGLWLAGWDVARFVPWLAGFLVLTITGERLELARMLSLDRFARRSFLAAAGIFLIGVTVTLVSVRWGMRVAGIGLLVFTAWLARYDVARRTVRQHGLTRYMAVCLLAGYGWLAVAGALWLRFATLADGPAYDAMLHATFLGFVIGMVFAHAPVIVPAVFRAEIPYRRYFYGHVVLLHASLVLRILGGDAFGNHLAWQIGGSLNEVALLGFLAAMVIAIRSHQQAKRMRSAAGGATASP
ncbi:hypothetical protein Acel_0500 [Acidothermus cellulolyticus 11B]|uniref:NnrS family protein n=1 Tax=Acidothermus cellulolyticus (strain ATCC 43068 / DSM 8971 / 11B) TaxID=351607 RepID=A0LS63_ACIC1|nr:hypothetical protein [Acidothermus cellulolyticus]ABK52273.1 hypothetical protein Acel_0500 [Acidothermus cellulolyticus 11B]